MSTKENTLELAEKLTQATEIEKEYIKGYMSGVMASRAKLDEMEKMLRKELEHKKTA